MKKTFLLTLQIAHALTHLHVHGIVHRDLKPENIMLTAQGGVKLIDFGIAKFYMNQEGVPSHMGTPAYMSPEQRKNPHTASFPTDIFSLGVIIYELILGRLSYGTIQISLVPKGLQRLIGKMLQPEIQQRFEDIVDVVQALSRYLASGELEKDMRGTDYIGELNEDLKDAQAIVLPTTFPNWAGVNIGFASNCNMALSAVYYDFFEQSQGNYSIVMGESLSTGVKGLLEIAMLRGMVRSLAYMQMKPNELVESLNNMLVQLNGDQTFSFALLTLTPREQRFSFISCGYNSLWQVSSSRQVPRRISSNNVALGIKSSISFMGIDANWAVGDNLILHTFQAGNAKSIQDVDRDEQYFLNSLTQNLHLPPQKQVDAIFRAITNNEGKALLQKLVTLISIERSE